jgi:tRNA (cytidine/uridine-2'-O-)-methyltransferase
MFNVVLVEPEIPPNTGSVGRLCLATRSTLHLVRPLGFSIDDRVLKRAGLDYWPEVDLRRWDSLGELQAAQPPGARYFFLTTKSDRPYYSVRFQPGDFLVFGRETRGLPEALLRANPERSLTIPMHGTRSLNLATAVAIVLFEAVRQVHASAAK